MRLLLTLGLKSMVVAGVEMKPLKHVLTVSFERVGSYTSPHILIFYRWRTHLFFSNIVATGKIMIKSKTGSS